MDLMIALATVGVIGYALYYVFTEQDGGGCRAAQSFKEARAAAPVGSAAPVASVAASAAPAVAVRRVAEPPAKPAVPPAPPAAPAPAAAAPAPAAARHSAEATMLRDPQTGETAAVPSNYRFAKKWVKEALVAEGLLDKIYKNNELDEAAGEKIKAALEQLKALAKYQA